MAARPLLRRGGRSQECHLLGAIEVGELIGRVGKLELLCGERPSRLQALRSAVAQHQPLTRVGAT